MSAPTIVNYPVSIETLFKTVAAAIAKLGYAIQSMDRDTGLITFSAGRQQVNGSAYMEALTADQTRLTIAGSTNQASLTTAALVGRASLAVNVMSSIDAPARVAREITDAVGQMLGQGKVVSAPNANKALIIMLILGVIFLFVFLSMLSTCSSRTY